MKKFTILTLLVFIFAPGLIVAHQPRIVDQITIDVAAPEVSKAFYARLSGKPHIYRIVSGKPFSMYVGLLLPARLGQEKDVSVAIFKSSNEDVPLAVLEGRNFAWKHFYERFGADHYFMGPQFKKELLAGDYRVLVWSGKNDARYTLAIGEYESFPFGEAINAMRLIPKLKRDFFGSSPFTFLKSPFGIAYVVIMLVFAFAAGFAFRAVVCQFSKSGVRKKSRNIAKTDRLLRALLGAVLLIVGIHTWSPILLFFAGFCFFEAVFSWCGFYAAIGKDSCPLN